MGSAPTPDRDVERRLLAQQALLKRLARGLVDDDASADDLVQDAEVLALGRDERPPVGWFAGTLRRLARSGRRATARRAVREARAARPEALPPDQDALARRLDLQAWLAARLRALPAEQAHALALRYGDELAPAEIARRLGVPEATVKTRLRRGLAALRAALDAEHGHDRWPLALAAWATPRATSAEAVAGTGVPATTLAGLAAVAAALVAAVAWAAGVVDGATEHAAEPLTAWSTGATGSEDASWGPDPTRPPAPPPALASAGGAGPARRSARASDAADPPPPAAPIRPPSETAAPAGTDAREVPRLSMQSPGPAPEWAHLRVRIVGAALDDAATRALTGRLRCEVDGWPQREVELRGDGAGPTVDLRVPARSALRLGATLDGYHTEAVLVDTATAGEWTDVELAARATPDSADLVLLLDVTRGGPHVDELEGVRFLVGLTEAASEPRALAMPLRRVTVRGGRLAVGRLPAGEWVVDLAPQGALGWHAKDMLLARERVQVQPGESAVRPVSVQRSGTFSLVVRGPDGGPLAAYAAVEDGDGVRRDVRFVFNDGTAYSGPTTHRKLAAWAFPPLRPGLVTAHVRCEGYAPATHALVVREGEVAAVELTLQRE